MNAKLTANDWVAMFDEVGLTTAQKQQWHKTFESRHPEAHQAFLESLDLPAKRIEQIRAQSK
jgi:hypothetical protein